MNGFLNEIPLVVIEETMSVFEQILVDLILGGKILGPVFIHSNQGTAILNASAEGLNAILAAHQQAQMTVSDKK